MGIYVQQDGFDMSYLTLSRTKGEWQRITLGWHPCSSSRAEFLRRISIEPFCLFDEGFLSIQIVYLKTLYPLAFPFLSLRGQSIAFFLPSLVRAFYCRGDTCTSNMIIRGLCIFQKVAWKVRGPAFSPLSTTFVRDSLSDSR